MDLFTNIYNIWKQRQPYNKPLKPTSPNYHHTRLFYNDKLFNKKIYEQYRSNVFYNNLFKKNWANFKTNEAFTLDKINKTPNILKDQPNSLEVSKFVLFGSVCSILGVGFYAYSHYIKSKNLV